MTGPKASTFHDRAKIDLHLHLDGAIRTGTLFELAKEHGVSLPADTPGELESHVTVPPECRSLSDFLDCFETFYPVIQYPDAVERIAYELCEDLARDTVIYAEVRFAPILLTEAGFSQARIVESALEGFNRGTDEFDTSVGVVLCLYRGTDPDDSLETVEVARSHREKGIVGVDLAGDESEFAADVHREAFEAAREAGFGLTIHAGEAGPAENVREALELGADRIGHGVRAVEDKSLLDELDDRNTILEVCLTSNLQTQAVSSVENHPVRSLYERGLNVTINTDDPRVSRTTLTDEYRRLREAFDLGVAEFRQLLLNSASGAFVDDNVRELLKRKINEAWKDGVS